MGFGHILVIVLTTVYFCKPAWSFDVKVIEAGVNVGIHGTVSINQENTYRFKIPEAHSNDSFIRVEFSSSLNSSLQCPIYFVVRQRDEVKPISLPQSHEASNRSIYSGARTLCMRPEKWASFIFVAVSTCNLDNVTYYLTLSVQRGYIIKLNEIKVATNISETSPVFHRFGFPEGVDFVRIIANSTTNSTTFMSIQPPECPIRDELSTIKHSGQWQTMSERTSLVVQKQAYPKGFILLFLPDPRTNPHPRITATSHLETISFKVVAPQTDAFIPSMWVPMLIYASFILLVFTVYSYCHHQYVGGGNTQFTPEFLQCVCPRNICDTSVRVDGFTADSNLYKYLKANSYRYIWTTLTIIFFYGLPVILLSITLIRFSKATGDLDTCHFNYNCAYPLWIFVSFNHVYSCLGFVILGPTFMFLVHLRAKKLVVNEVNGEAVRAEAEVPTRWRWCRFRRVNLTGTVYGAYQNFGTFYTLGFALMFVGIMKMAYNTCPNRDTTFFGLTFMFIVALLCQIKIYNLRHPCMVTDNFTFVSIGMVIGTITSGYLIVDDTFRIVVSVLISFWIQLTILILHSAGYAIERDVGNSSPPADNDLEDPVPATAPRQCTPVETVKLINSPTALFRNIFISCNIGSLFRSEWKRRIFWVLLRFVLNVGVLAFIWLKMTENHFTTRMYVLVLSNFLMDFIYYFVILKCCHHEYYKATSWQPILYLLLAAIFWVASLIFLANSLGAWELPSILLQQHFTPCALGIFDVLDMYHWTAAPAWFFTFMVMLTADDPLSRNRTEMTVVF